MAMLNLQKHARYWRTVRQLPPSQVAHRMRLRSQRAGYRRLPLDLEARWGSSVPTEGRWPAGFAPIDASVDHQPPAEDGAIELVGESHRPLVAGWRPTERSQLFRYHLHYFDWAWALAREHDRPRFEEFWGSWRADTEPGRWDEWSPYVVSRRAWTLCSVFGSLVAGSAIEDDVLGHLRGCLGFLRRNLEQDVGGNHLLANLKALYGLGVFFEQDDVSVLAAEGIQAQVEVQILGDGGHYELSPSYHAHVLADLIDLDRLAVAIGGEARNADAIAEMQGWLRSVVFPDCSLPTLGDCTPLPGGLLEAVLGDASEADAGVDAPRPLVEQAVAEQSVVHHEDTGIVVLRPRPGAMLVLDLGHPGPPELPAHIQSDWGTFELWLDGRRAVVDPGVSTYVGGRRLWERSTPAHNTVSCDAMEQTEVWDSFRAGRRAAAGPVRIEHDGSRVTVVATLSGLPGGKTHTRTVTANADLVHIGDRVENVHSAYSRLTVSTTADAARVTAGHPTLSSPVEVGVGFGRLENAIQITQRLNHSSGWFQISLQQGDLDG